MAGIGHHGNPLLLVTSRQFISVKIIIIVYMHSTHREPHFIACLLAEVIFFLTWVESRLLP